MEPWYTDAGYDGTMIATTPKGWMTSDIFLAWFKKFCEDVTQRPILLIYDGHSTHINLALINKAREENVTLLKLPPHTTDKLQPLDKCCFRPLKVEWDKTLHKWSQVNHSRRLQKKEFIIMTGKNIFLLKIALILVSLLYFSTIIFLYTVILDNIHLY